MPKRNPPAPPARPSPPGANRPLRERLQSTFFESEAAPAQAAVAATVPQAASPSHFPPLAEPGSAQAQVRHPITISELTDRITRQLALGFSTVCVMGEISQVRTVASGHTYFTLKDPGATLDAMVWADRKDSLAVQPQQGMRVIALGAVRIFAASGRYSLHVDVLEPLGAGELQRALEALKARLLAEGLFADARKRKLPALLRTVGLVTSATGAVRHDIERTLVKGGARVRLLLSPTRVQGEGASVEIATAIRLLAERDEVDLIVIARGGGSAEELWPFNEEVVARAIAASRPPVISAVGHETDFTVADLVADVRASTPSVAAGIIVEIMRHANERVDLASVGLKRAMDARRDRWRARLDAVSTHRVMERERTKLERLRGRLGAAFARAQVAVDRGHATRLGVLRDLASRCGALSPRQTFARAHGRIDRAVRAMGAGMALQFDRRRARARRAFESSALREASVRLSRINIRFDEIRRRLTRSLRPAVDQRRAALGQLAGQLEALSPLAVLSRGYALATTSEGRILLRTKDAAVGDSIVVRLSDGRIKATVTHQEEER